MLAVFNAMWSYAVNDLLWILTIISGKYQRTNHMVLRYVWHDLFCVVANNRFFLYQVWNASTGCHQPMNLWCLLRCILSDRNEMKAVCSGFHFISFQFILFCFISVAVYAPLVTFSDSEWYHRWNNKQQMSQHGGLALPWLCNGNGNGYGQCIYSLDLGIFIIQHDEVTAKLSTGTWILSAHELRQLRNNISVLYTGWSKKMAQSLWHHNFATVHHRFMRFSTKCSERNSLHD